MEKSLWKWLLLSSPTSKQQIKEKAWYNNQKRKLIWRKTQWKKDRSAKWNQEKWSKSIPNKWSQSISERFRSENQNSTWWSRKWTIPTNEKTKVWSLKSMKKSSKNTSWLSTSNWKKKQILHFHQRRMQQKRALKRRNIQDIKPEHQTT